MDGAIPGVATALTLPPGVVEAIAPAREVAAEAVVDCQTYETMLRELRASKESIQSLDTYFWIEEEFLEKELPMLACELVQNALLELLPAAPSAQPEKGKGLSDGEKIYADMVALGRRNLVTRSQWNCSSSVAKIAEGSCTILRAILDGTSLSSSASGTCSEFHKLLYARCANFLRHDIVEKVGKTKRTKTLVGAVAMRAMLQDLDKQKEGSEAPDSPELRVFRQFRFLVPNEWVKRVISMIAEARKRRSSLLGGRMIKDKAPGDDEEQAPSADKPTKCNAVATKAVASAATGSASSSSVKSGAGKNSSQENAAKKQKLSQDDVMALFYPSKK